MKTSQVTSGGGDFLTHTVYIAIILTKSQYRVAVVGMSLRVCNSKMVANMLYELTSPLTTISPDNVSSSTLKSIYRLLFT